MCGIRLTNTKPCIDIVVCYRPPGKNLSQDEWNKITWNVNTDRLTILVGDFDAHNMAWNCKYTDTNGKRLLESSEATNLILHNCNTITRSDFHRNFHSNIDLLFSTANIAAGINVEAYDETLDSDHYPLLCNVQIEKSLYIKKSLRINSIKTDWLKVRTDLDEKYLEFLSAEYDSLSPQ